MSINSNSSLLERLQTHDQEGYLSLHMPGHKENTGLASYLNILNAHLLQNHKLYLMRDTLWDPTCRS